MKKRILLLTAVAALGYVLLTSYAGGPGMLGQNRTGARLSVTNCGTVGSGCHGGAGAATTVSITVDSAGGVPTTHYVPGGVYTVKIHGTNSSSLPKYGFEFIAVSGTGSAQAQAGTASGLPAGVANHSHFPTGLIITEHTMGLNATTPGNYDMQFTWTAPSTAVGNITMYCTLNAVNGGNSADAADISGNTSITLTPVTPPASVAAVYGNMGFSAYPNPVMNTLYLQTENNGTYAVRVYDLNGRSVADEQITIGGGSASIDAVNWVPGFYQVVVEKDGMTQLVRVVKNP